MGKPISTLELSESLSLTECSDGFWLYDKTRGMNLSMRAKTPQAAFVECIGYYQRRLSEVEKKHREISAKVEAFVDQFKETDEDA